MGFTEKFKIYFDADTKSVRKGLNDVTRRTDMFGSGISTLSRRINTQFVGALQVAVYQLKQFSTELTKVGAEFEQSITTLGAIKGARPEELSAFSEEARRLGASTAYTATQAAEGMQQLARAGLTASEILKITGSALQFAGANAVTMNASTKLLAATMKQFGLEAFQANQVLDTFTTSTQNSLFDVESLSVAMRYGGSVASSLGADLNETVAVMSSFRDLGLEGSMVGTRFRQVLLSLAAPTKKAKEILKDYNISLDDLKVKERGITEVLRTLANAGLITAEALAPIVSKRAAGSLSKINEELQGTVSLVKLNEQAIIAYGKSFDDLSKNEREFVAKSVKVKQEAFNTIRNEQVALDKYGKDFSKLTSDQQKEISRLVASQSSSLKDLNNAINTIDPTTFNKLYKDLQKTGELDFDNIVSSIDLMQMKFVENAGVTAKTYTQMIDTVQGQYKILLSAIEEFQIASFKALNQEMSIKVNGVDTSAFVGFKDILQMVKDEVDSFALIISSNMEFISGAFTDTFGILKQSLLDFLQIGTDGLFSDTDEFYASLLGGISQFNRSLEEALSYIPTFNTLFSVGKFAFFGVIAAGIRSAIALFAQFIGQFGFVLAKASQLSGLINTWATGTERTIAPTANLTFKLQGVVQVLLIIAETLNTIAIMMSSLPGIGIKFTQSLERTSAQVGILQAQFQQLTLAQTATTTGMQASAIGGMVKGVKDFGASIPIVGTAAAKSARGISAIGTAIGTAGKAVMRFLTGPWGLLLTGLFMFKDPIWSATKSVINFTTEVLGFGPVFKTATDETQALADSAKYLKNTLDSLDASILKDFADVDISNNAQRDAAQSLKATLINQGEANTALLTELNLVRDLTEERKKELVLAGDLLKYKVSTIDGEKEVLLTTNAINELRKTQFGIDEDILDQRSAMVAQAEQMTQQYTEQELQQVELAKKALVSAEKFKDNGLLFDMYMQDASQILSQIGGDFSNISANMTNDILGMQRALGQVNAELQKQGKISSYHNKLQTEFNDKLEKEVAMEKQKTKSSGSRKKSKLLKLEDKIYRERLKVAAKRINETKALEQQFKIEDLRKKYDEEVKYFGKSRKDMIKIETSFANAILTIAKTTQDRYFQDMKERRSDALRELSKLEGTTISGIESDTAEEIKEVNKYYEEFVRLQRNSFQESQKASANLVDIGVKGISKKDKAKLQTEISEIQSDLLDYRDQFTSDIAEIDNSYDSRRLLTDKGYMEMYQSELAMAQQMYKSNLKEYTESVVTKGSGLEKEVLSKALSNNVDLFQKFFKQSIDQQDVYSNSLVKRKTAQYDEEYVLERKRDAKIEEIRKQHNETILAVEDSYFSKYDTPFRELELQRDAAIAKLELEGATLEDIARLRNAYNQKFLFDQEQAINETARQYGDLTEVMMGLQVGQIVGNVADQFGVKGVKKFFDTSVGLFDDLYNIQQKFLADQARLKDSLTDTAELQAIDKGLEQYKEEIAGIDEEISNLYMAEVQRKQSIAQDLQNTLQSLNIDDIELGVNLNQDSIDEIQNKINSLELEAADLYLSGEDKDQISANQKGMQASQLEDALNLAKEQNAVEEKTTKENIKGLDVRRNELVEKSKMLKSEKASKILANERVQSALKLLKAQKVIAFLLKISAIAISSIVALFGLLKKYIEAMISFYKKFINLVKKGYDFTKKVVDYFTGGLQFNVFDSLAESVDNFISKEDELLDKQKELEDQLARRDITQADYDKAISGGLVDIDATQIAKDFFNEIYQQATQRINAFIKMAPIAFKYFEKIIDPIFKRLRKALPRISKALSDTVPQFLTTVAKNMINFFPVIMEGARNFIANTIEEFLKLAPQAIVRIVEVIKDEGMKAFDMIMTYLPSIAEALKTILPDVLNFIEELLDYLGKNMGQLTPYIISIFGTLSKIFNKFLFELVENTIQAVLNAIGSVIGEIVKSIADFTGFTSTPEERKEKRQDFFGRVGEMFSFGDTPGVIQAGTDGLMARFKAGDYVIASQEPQVMLREVLGSFTNGLNSMVSGSNSSTSTPPPPMQGNTSNVDIAIIAEGRLLDAVQVSAIDRGHAPKMQRKLRRASGVNVGFDRGKFNRF